MSGICPIHRQHMDRHPASLDQSITSNSGAQGALLSAFARLALSRRYREFGVDAIARAANVARSTFYYHFAGKDDLLLHNLRPLISELAEMPFTARDSDELRYWVAHIWEHRRFSSRLLDGDTGRKIEAATFRGLNEMLATRQPSAKHNALLAAQISGGSVALLKAWTSNRVTATPSDIAHTLWSSAVSVRNSPPCGLK